MYVSLLRLYVQLSLMNKVVYIETIKNPGGGKIFRTRPDRPWGPPSLLHNMYRVFPGGQAASLSAEVENQ
jgi:hypothetical protein